MERARLGALAERLAAEFLSKRGYCVEAMNYRKPWGELDIVASKDKVIVFVEVKANQQYLQGFNPELRANPEKMRKVLRTARTYLLDKKYDPDQEWQIDVVSVTFNKEKQSAHLEHFKNIEI